MKINYGIFQLEKSKLQEINDKNWVKALATLSSYIQVRQIAALHDSDCKTL